MTMIDVAAPVGRLAAPNDSVRRFLAEAARETARIVELPASRSSQSRPSVSVVVALHNRRDLALQLVDALARQSGAAFEVVLVDDGSPDEVFDAVAQHAATRGLTGSVVRLPRSRERAVARNVGLLLTRAELVAFTDDDCSPDAGWLAAGVSAFEPNIGIVQGLTAPPPWVRPPFFSHFIAIERLDGTFATSNVFYRKQAVFDVGGFDPQWVPTEDLDLGQRVVAHGWGARFVSEARVFHQVLPEAPLAWMMRPTRLAAWPRDVARYPDCRRYLFARCWISATHAALTAALLGVTVSLLYRPAVLLAVPYAAMFARCHGLSGRWPIAKVALHAWWDFFGLTCLAASSIRHRSLVL